MERAALLRLTLHDLLPAGDSSDEAAGGGADAGPSGLRTHLTPDGRRLQLDLRSRPVDYAGRAADLVCARDVTDLVSMAAERDERGRRERELRRSAERSTHRFQSLFEALPERFMVLDPHTFGIVAVSDALLGTTMRDREALVGLPVPEAFPDDPDDPTTDGVHSWQASLRRVLATGRADAMGIPALSDPASGRSLRGPLLESGECPRQRTPRRDRLDHAPGGRHHRAGAERSRRPGDARAGQAQLENAQRLAGLGIREFDPATGVGYASDPAMDIPGLERGAETVGFAAFLEAVHPDDRGRTQRQLERMRDGDSTPDATLRIVRPRRGERSIRTVARLVETEEGPRLAGALQDISELIRIRDEREALLETDADRLIGRVLRDAFPDAAGSRFEQEYRRAMEGGKTTSFDAFYDGLGRWFRVIANPTPEGIAVQFRDISAERARTDQLHLFETALKQLNDLVIITEAAPLDVPDGPRIVHVNDAFVRITGYSREEAIGATPRLLQGPETERSELDRIRRALETRRPVRAELTNRSRGGAPLSLELSIVPIFDGDGRCSHFVAIERDIGARLRTERALRLDNERFELLARATTDIIYDRDVAAARVWWNHNLTAVLDHDREELAAGLELWQATN